MPKVSPKLDSALSHLFSSLPSSAVSAEDMQVRAVARVRMLRCTCSLIAISHGATMHDALHCMLCEPPAASAVCAAPRGSKGQAWTHMWLS